MTVTMSTVDGGSSREVISRSVDRPRVGQDINTLVELGLPADDNYRLDIKLYDQPGGAGTVVTGVRHDDIEVKPGANISYPTTCVDDGNLSHGTTTSQPEQSRIEVGDELTITWKTTFSPDRAEFIVWENLQIAENTNPAVTSVDLAPLGYPSNRIQLRVLSEGTSRIRPSSPRIGTDLEFLFIAGPSTFDIEPLTNAQSSYVTAVSDDGTVVSGVSRDGETDQVFRWP